MTRQQGDASLVILRTDILSPAAQALISSLNAELSATYPEQGACHFRLDPQEVSDGHGAFFIVSRAGQPIGCGAIRRIEEKTGELKRMYVIAPERSRGVGRALVEALESHARSVGLHRLVLETGVRQLAAIALYRRLGFADIPPFGEYTTSPLSVCMAKDL